MPTVDFPLCSDNHANESVTAPIDSDIHSKTGVSAGDEFGQKLSSEQTALRHIWDERIALKETSSHAEGTGMLEVGAISNVVHTVHTGMQSASDTGCERIAEGFDHRLHALSVSGHIKWAHPFDLHHAPHLR